MLCNPNKPPTKQTKKSRHFISVALFIHIPEPETWMRIKQSDEIKMQLYIGIVVRGLQIDRCLFFSFFFDVFIYLYN